MSGFEFDLQKILELREQEEQEQARALAEAERRAREAQRQLELLQQIQEEEAGKLMSAHSEGRAVGHLRNLNVVIRQLSDRVDEAEAACREALEEVEKSRADLVEAMTQRRVLDHLREKKREAWRLAEAEADRKRMDELALGMFQRRTAGGGGR